jgi:hypothetical protein
MADANSGAPLGAWGTGTVRLYRDRLEVDVAAFLKVNEKRVFPLQDIESVEVDAPFFMGSLLITAYGKRWRIHLDEPAREARDAIAAALPAKPTSI